MKKINKKLPYILLSVGIALSGCVSTINDENLIKIVGNPVISIPSSDRGAISGDIDFNISLTDVPPEATILVIRNEDIPEKDKDGKIIKDKFLERKGQNLANIKVLRGQYYIPDLRPGSVTLVVNSKQEKQEASAVIKAGVVTKVNTLYFNSLKETSNKQTIIFNITGKVVNQAGEIVPNAKVTDITDGNLPTAPSVTTDGEGRFSIQVSSFDKPRSLEVSFQNLTTSISVNPELSEELTITLIPNSRKVTGIVFDSVIKSKPISGAIVRLSNSNISTVTNDKGEFSISGVPLNSGVIELGFLDGYINKTVTIAQASTSEPLDLKTILIQPLGNLFVNIIADNKEPFPGQGPFLTQLPGADTVVSQNGIQVFYYNNDVIFKNPLNGTIQLEGTSLIKDFKYPATELVDPLPRNITGFISAAVEVYKRNPSISIPIKNVPGGEYTLSIALEHHETQKGIKIVIPSNDTIATELIKLNLTQNIVSAGDIRGKVLLKDASNNNTITEGVGNLKVRAYALSGAFDLSDATRVKNEIINMGSTDVRAADVASDGTFIIKDVPSGSRVVYVAVINGAGDDRDTGYLPGSSVLLNVVGNTINEAFEITITKRP